MKKPPSLRSLQLRCDRWNAAHLIGCEVWYHPVIGEPQCAKYRTRTGAQVLFHMAWPRYSAVSGHTCVLWLEGKSGCVALEALSDEPFGGKAA